MSKQELFQRRAQISDQLAEIAGELASLDARIATLHESPHLTRNPDQAEEELLRARTKRAHLVRVDALLRSELEAISLDLLDAMLGIVDTIADKIEVILDPGSTTPSA